MNSLISICLATYNGETYIQEQLDSIVKQTYREFELIVQDDNSTDNTLEIIKSYEKFIKIKIEKNKTNIGYAKNFEKVLKRASAEYIAICDQDDIWDENKLEILINSIGTNTLVYSNSLLMNENGESLNKSLSDKLKNNFISSNQPLNFLYDNSVSAHAVLFKKELLNHLFPFPQHIYFDQYIAMVAASLQGVQFIDKNLVNYRQHAKNTLGNRQKSKDSLTSKIKNKLQKKLDNNNDFLNKIKDVKNIKTLSLNDKNILLNLKNIHLNFLFSIYSLSALIFFLTYKDILFAIGKKNKIILSIKKSIGYKLYKVLPIL